MRKRKRIQTDSRRGSTAVELSLVFLLLMTLFVGIADFGRLFFQALTVTNAASTGALSGSMSGEAAGNMAAMESRAESDDAGVSGLTATAEQYCACPGQPPLASCVDLLQTNCAGGYGTPRAYVRVTASSTLQPYAPFHLTPTSTAVDRRVWMRVR